MKTLTEKQKKALDIFCGIKSAYRRDEFERNQLDYDSMCAELIEAGYLKKNKAGALSLSKQADDVLNNRLNRQDPIVAAICAAIGYNGQKISYTLNEAPNELNSYWDGGSKDSYTFFNLDTLKAFQLPSNHPFFEADKPRTLNGLPPRVLLIKHTIFCGKDLGLTIYSNSEDRAKLIGSPIE